MSVSGVVDVLTSLPIRRRGRRRWALVLDSGGGGRHPGISTVGAGEPSWLLAIVGSDGGRSRVVVGDGGGRRWAVVVVVGERAGDVTVSHDEPDLASSGPRPTRCPQKDINCSPLNSAMAQWL